MGRKPDFLIVGPPKTGTTSLYTALKDHDEIGIPEEKELHFFEDYEIFEKGVDWYCSHFEPLRDKKVVGEVTPSYFASGMARARVFKHFPEVKVICILREPIQRLLSQFLHFRSTNLALRTMKPEEIGIIGNFSGEVYDLPELIKSIRLGPTGDRWGYISAGEYYVHLREWQDLLGKDQVYVLFFEELIADPTVEIGKLLRWLDLSQRLPSFKKVNSGDIWKELSPDINISLEPEDREWLREHFKPYNEMLFRYLGRSPAIWEAAT